MEFVGNIEFGQPRFIMYLPVAVMAVLTISAIWMKRRRKILLFLGKSRGNIYSPWRIYCYLVLLWMYACGLTLLLCEPYAKVAVAREIYEPVYIVFAVDISKSMLALTGEDYESAATSDCALTRLNEVAGQVLNFISRVENEQAVTVRLALVVFARHAYPVIPLFTDDFQLFKRRLQQELSVKNIIHVPEGSNHWYALERSLEIFPADGSHKKILIMLTDGEPDMPKDVLLQNKSKALKAMRNSKEVDFRVIGIGQPHVRKPIYAVWSANGCPEISQGFLRQTEGEGQGEIMWTMADLAKLKDFAAETGGQYIHSATGNELSEHLQGIISQKFRKTGVAHETTRYDLSKPIIIGLLVLQGVLVLLKTP